MAKIQVSVDYIKENLHLTNIDTQAKITIPYDEWEEIIKKIGKKHSLKYITSGPYASAFGKTFKKMHMKDKILQLIIHSDPETNTFHDEKIYFPLAQTPSKKKLY